MEKIARCVLRKSAIEVWPNTLHVMLSVLYEDETFKFEVAHADTNQAGYLTGRGRGAITYNNPEQAFRDYEMRVNANRSIEAMNNNKQLISL